MRKELMYHKPDAEKLKMAEELIEQIANGEGDAAEALRKLEELTGKRQEEAEFSEYWSHTDLDVIAEETLVEEAPLVQDLTREELIEIVSVMSDAFYNGEDGKLLFYEDLLYKSLSLPYAADYIMQFVGTYEELADRMLSDAKNGNILL